MSVVVIARPYTALSCCGSNNATTQQHNVVVLVTTPHYTVKLGPRINGPRRCLFSCPGDSAFPILPRLGVRSLLPGLEGFAEERPVVEEQSRARAACDLEGDRAGLGCLEHLRMCFVVRSGHGVACRSVSTSPLTVTTSCLSSRRLANPARASVCRVKLRTNLLLIADHNTPDAHALPV